MEASCKTVEAGERKEKQKHALEARKLFLQQSFIMKSKFAFLRGAGRIIKIRFFNFS